MVLAGVIAGAAFGAWRARRRRGNRLDMAQWGAVYAIIFGMIGLFVTIALGRLG
jgi:hypothetical protein